MVDRAGWWGGEAVVTLTGMVWAGLHEQEAPAVPRAGGRTF